jgi:hypothetical protein
VADYTYSVKHIEVHRWSLPTPANGVELNKAVTAAATEFRTQHGRGISYDDDLQIDVEDDAVIVWFSLKGDGE